MTDQPVFADFRDAIRDEYSLDRRLGRAEYELHDEKDENPLSWAARFCALRKAHFVLLRRLPKPYVSVYELFYSED